MSLPKETIQNFFCLNVFIVCTVFKIQQLVSFTEGKNYILFQTNNYNILTIPLYTQKHDISTLISELYQMMFSENIFHADNICLNKDKHFFVQFMQTYSVSNGRNLTVISSFRSLQHTVIMYISYSINHYILLVLYQNNSKENLKKHNINQLICNNQTIIQFQNHQMISKFPIQC